MQSRYCAQAAVPIISELMRRRRTTKAKQYNERTVWLIGKLIDLQHGLPKRKDCRERTRGGGRARSRAVDAIRSQ